MSPTEFSDRFEVLYNSIMSNAAPGLNEYEKSVFLTKAQDEIVKNYFNPQGNKYKEGFDQSPRRQVNFSMLVKSTTLSAASTQNPYDPRGIIYPFPNNLFALLNEQVILTNGANRVGVRQVVPISYMEYSRLMSKPYKEPLKNQAWRLITGKDNDNSHAELILNNNDRQFQHAYSIRYVRRPRPIITADLSSAVGDVTIDDEHLPSSGELDESIHEEILQRAVEIAKASYASDQSGQAQLQNQITVGQRSE